MPQFNAPSLVTSMAANDILLVWKTLTGSVQTITFSNFAASVVIAGGGGGIPGGAATQVQYNNAGVFGGITNATTDGTTLTLTSPVITTPTGLVKNDVGLGSVDNTSDVNKPISTATQTALNLKADSNNAALTGTPTAPTAALGTNTTQIATTAFVAASASGTVTSVSVVSANGFSGSVATPTVTPAITIGTTITGILKGNGAAISAATTTGTVDVVLSTSPTLITPVLGVATATSINKVAFTPPASAATLTILNNKTFTVNNTITLAGTDAQTYTFPTTSATLARIDAANSWQAGVRQTFGPNATTPGFNPGAVSGDPSGLSNGDIWYDSTGNLLRARINGASVSLGAGGGGSGTVNSGTATNMAYYIGTGTVVDGTPTMTVSSTGRIGITPTAVTSGVATYLTITSPSDTALTAGTESVGVNFIASTRQHASNTAITSQREIVFNAPTYSFASATGTITNAATVSITNAPITGTNAVITNAFALWLQAGSIGFGASGSIASISYASGALTLAASGTNQNINLSPSGSGFVRVNDADYKVFTGGVERTTFSYSGGGGYTFIYNNAYGQDVMRAYNGGFLALAPVSGNVIIGGGSSDAGTGKLQLPSSASTTAGIAMGDAAIYRSGTTLMVTNSGFTSKFATGGIGYSTGAGGTVTQATSKVTAFTLSKVCGQITTPADALGGGAIASSTWTNTAIAATDIVVINHVSGGTVGAYTFNVQCGAGTATLNIRNATGGSLSEALVLTFGVYKVATS